MTRLIRRFLSNESGATAIEYGLIVAMIFLVIVGAVSLFAGKATGTFDKVSTAVSAAIT
ncbi:Flp family type IVb pilin [Brevundimonas sp.]|uniref:Flp family type IVb pilin n=1 Tax=Brevundimonas sp. TaxID=1871086 RepID=UPI00286BF6D4|nr:Flp family type IVb pilin [Brevundimonas sp.]